MKRSNCCKSELVYISDGKMKIDRTNIRAIDDLIQKKTHESDFYFECGACNQCCELTERPHFTNEQIDYICYQIGDWYLMMKPLLEGQHNLGFMKEKLKIMICGDERNAE